MQKFRFLAATPLFLAATALVALVACASPIRPAATATGAGVIPANPFMVQVSWVGNPGRGIGNDSSVTSVEIRVWTDGGDLMGTGNLTKTGGSWKGAIEVSATGLASFKAYAKDSGGHLLYNGVQQTTLSGTGDDVSIGMSAPSAITYDGNGETSGAPPADSATYATNDTVSVAGSGTLAKTGYAFAGWTTNCADAGSSYAAEATFSKPSGNVILYAVWVPTSLTFSSSGSTISITGYSTPPSGDLSIPVGVTKIGAYAFYLVAGLTTVEFPESLTEIGDEAFEYCTGLTAVHLPASVSAIGNGSFARCSSLTALTVDSGNPSFKSVDGAIYSKAGSSLVEVPGAASGTFIVPNGVTTVGHGAFRGCDSLTDVQLPTSLTTIEQDAFSLCSSLSTLTIPEGVTTIGARAFFGSAALQSISLPTTLLSMGDWVFMSCGGLASLSIPASVTSIGDQPLSECLALTSLSVDPSNGSYESINNALLNKAGTVLIAVAAAGVSGAYSVPDGVTTIAKYALRDCRSITSLSIPSTVVSLSEAVFSNCSSLTSVTLPDGIGYLLDSTFSGCTNLASVSLPASLTYLGSQAFYGCEKLTSLTIPGSVTHIGWSAFQNSGLTSIDIPSGVTNLGTYAFYGCSSLVTVTCEPTTPPALSSGSNAFSGCAPGLQILVPPSSLTTYQSATGWADYGSNLGTIPS